MTQRIFRLFLIIGWLYAPALALAQTQYSDGPMRVRSMLDWFYKQSNSDAPLNGEFTWINWNRDNANLDGCDWIGGPGSAAGCQIYTGTWQGSGGSGWYDFADIDIFNYLYTTNNVPRLLESEIESWEDDCFDCYRGCGFLCYRCDQCSNGRDTYNSPCNCSTNILCGCTEDDNYCPRSRIKDASNREVEFRYFQPSITVITPDYFTSACGSDNAGASFKFLYETPRPGYLNSTGVSYCVSGMPTLTWGMYTVPGNYANRWQTAASGGSYILWLNGSDILTTTSTSYTPAAALGPGTYNYRIYATNQGMRSRGYQEITVVVYPAIANNAITSGSQTICAGINPSTVTATTPTGGTNSYIYDWQISSTGIGGPYSSLGITSQNLSLLAAQVPNSTSSPITYYVRRVVTSTPCDGANASTSGSIAITVEPGINNNTATANQSVCSGQTPNVLNGSGPPVLAGGTGAFSYQWQSAPALVGPFTNIPAATGGTNEDLDFNLLPAVTVTTFYRRVVTSGTCVSVSNVLQITVNPALTGNAITSISPQIVCSGVPPDTIFASPLGSIAGGGGGPYTFQWQRSTDLITWADIPAANGANLTFISGLATTTYYRRAVSSALCTTWAGPYEVQVQPNVSNNTITTSGPMLLCNGQIPGSISATAPPLLSGGDGFNYSYQWQSSPDNATWVNITGAFSQNLFITTPATGTTFYRRIVTSGVCSSPSNSFEVSISGGPSPTVQLAASATIICPGEPVTFVALPGGPGSGQTFKWYINNVLTTGVGQTFVTNQLQNNDQIRVEMTVPSLCGGAAFGSNTITMTVHTAPTVTISAPGGGQCPGSLTFTATTNPATNVTVYWFKNSNFTGFTGTSFTTSNILDGDLITAYAVSTANSCTSSVSNIVIVQFLPTAIAGSILASQNPVCAGSTTLLTLSGYSGDSIRWEQLVGSSWVTFGGNTDVITSPVVSANTFIRAVVRYQGCSPVTTPVLTLSVLPGSIASVSITASKNVLCQGEQIIFTANPVNASGPSYTWYVNNVPVATTGSQYTTSLLNNGDSIQVVMSVSGSCASGSFPSNIISVTVNPTPTLSISQVVGTVCEGNPVSFYANVTPSGTPVHWYVNGQPTGVVSDTFKTTSLTNNDIVYAYAVTAANCSSHVSNNVLVGLSPIPQVIITSNIVRICQGGVVNFTATPVNAGLNPTYQWQVDSGLGFADVPGSTGATFSSNTLTDNNTVRCVITSAQGCSGLGSISNPISISVGEIPTVTITASDTVICAGEAVTFSVLSTTNAGTTPTYQWIINGQNVAANSSSFTTTTLQNGDVVRVVIRSQSGCSGATSFSNPITITVNPQPTVSVAAPGGTSVCPGTVVNLVATHTNGGANPIYQWKVNGINAGINSANFSFIPTGNAVVTCEITSTAGCSNVNSTSPAIIIQVLPAPVVTISVNQNNVCDGTQQTFVANATNAGGNPVYTWFINGLVTGSNSPVFSSTFLNLDTVTCIVSTASGCTSAVSNSIITVVKPIPTVAITASDTSICAGDTVLFTATAQNAGINPTYTWRLNNSIVGTSSATLVKTNLQDGDVITAQVTSADGCTSSGSVSNSITIRVSITPTVTLSITPTGAVCLGDMVNFSANGSPTIGSSYEWYLNGILVAGNNTPLLSTTTLANGDKVKVRIVSATGCSNNNSFSNEITAQVLPQPTVSISASPNPACVGQTIVFTPFPSNAGVNPLYEWYRNGVQVAMGSNFQSNNLANGDTIQARIISTAGCIGSMSNTVAISILPIPTVMISTPNTTICQGSSVTFTAVSSGNAGANPFYVWMVNGVTQPGFNGSTFTTTNLVNGAQVQATVTSTTGCSGSNSASNTIVMTIENAPTVVVTANNTSICQGGVVTFTATPNQPVTYQWRINGVNVPNALANTFTTSVLNHGDVVTCVVTSLNGCTSPLSVSNPVAITVTPLPTAVITASDTTICRGQTVIFTASAPGATGYQWQVNALNVGTNSPVYQSSTLQNGDVVTVIVSVSGCSNTIMSNPVLIQVSADPVVSVTASDTVICAGETVLFVPTVTNAGTSPTYQWQVNGINVPAPLGIGATFSSSNLNNGETVRVIVTSTDGCPVGGVASNAVIMVVNPIPSVAIIPSATTTCANSQIVFTAVPNNAGANPVYQWFVNGVVILGANSNVFTINTLQNGDSVKAQVTSTTGCVSLASNNVVMTVLASPTASITGPNSVCQNAEVLFSNTDTTGSASGATYLWNFGTGAVPGTANLENPPMVVYTTTGLKTVTLTKFFQNCSTSVTWLVTVLPKPTADFSIPSLNCLGGAPYSFTNTGTTGFGTQFFWDFGSSAQPSASVQENPTNIRFTTGGIHDVQLIVTQNGCSDTVTKQVLVDTLTGLNLGPDTSICIAETPYRLQTGISNALSYEWFRNGSLVGNDSVFLATQSGFYSVRVRTATGCEGTDVMELTVVPGLLVNLGPDLTTCYSSAPVILDAGVGNATYQWTRNGVVIQGAASQTLSVDSSGTYGVTVVRPSGCQGSDVIVVTITNVLSVDLGPNMLLCSVDPRPKLVAGNIPNATYIWTFNGTPIPNTTGLSEIIVQNAGLYGVTVVSGSCIAQDTVLVDIQNTISIDLGPDTSFCPTNPLVVITAPYIPMAAYTWTLDGTPLQVAGNNVIDYRVGEYAVSVVTPGGCTAADQIVVTQVPAPIAEFRSLPFIPGIISGRNPEVVFENLSQNYTGVLWDFGDSTTSTQVNPTHRYAKIGEYFVTLTVFNGNCSATIIHGPAIVANVDQVFVPTAFSPNGDNVNDIFSFPVIGLKSYTITIFNRWGQKVFSNETLTDFWKGTDIGGGQAPEGVYVYVIRGLRDNDEPFEQKGSVTLIR